MKKFFIFILVLLSTITLNIPLQNTTRQPENGSKPSPAAFYDSYNFYIKRNANLHSPAPIIKEPDKSKEPISPFLDYLRKHHRNDDIVGYINVHGTSISYPIVQDEHNSFYLDHNIQGRTDKAGWIFLDHQNSLHQNEKNTIIYGHNMANGKRFGDIRHFGDINFFNKNRYISLYTDYGIYTWEIFAFYISDTNFNYIQVVFPKDTFAKFLNEIKRRNKHCMGINISCDDRIITLSTCAAKGDTNLRYVLHAKLIHNEMQS